MPKKCANRKHDAPRSLVRVHRACKSHWKIAKCPSASSAWRIFIDQSTWYLYLLGTLYRRAVKGRATSISEPTNMFWVTGWRRSRMPDSTAELVPISGGEAGGILTMDGAATKKQ
jgi:hypothetical protein